VKKQQQKQSIEIFMPPNALKSKVGGGAATGIDMSAVKRAEEALETLKAEFGDWIAADVQMLAASRDAFLAEPSQERQGDLYRASHDLRGQARTFEFPLVERIATSLCRLLDAPVASKTMTLVDAHVGAIRVIVRDKIKDRMDPMASTLARELEARVSEFLAQPAKP
jgi:chemotaxis protein histidine kinase CheA